MIILTENKERKELYVYVIGNEQGYGSSEWQQAEVKRYTEMGYSIHSLIYPVYSKLPAEVQEIYSNAYKSKALLDTFIDVACEDVLPNILSQVVRSEISKFEVSDIAETVVDYETSMGLKSINKE